VSPKATECQACKMFTLGEGGGHVGAEGGQNGNGGSAVTARVSTRFELRRNYLRET